MVMAKRAIVVAFLVVAVSTAISCRSLISTGAGGATPQPTASVEAVPSPSGYSAEEQLRRYVEGFDKGASYAFTVEGDHSLTFEGQPQTWHYSGSGAYFSPDRFRWHLEGQADVMFDVVSVRGETRCADTRGVPVSNCSLLWGGPLPGTSPYILIEYLRKFDKVEDSGRRSIDGKEYAYFAFAPDKDRVATSVPGGAEHMARVVAVRGEVWVDVDTGLPKREVVSVRATSSTGQEQVMDVTIDFAGYGQPVEVELPTRTGG